MNWKQWPYYPKTLTDMVYIGDVPDKEFISIIVSGCSERLKRGLTILEPVLDKDDNPIIEYDQSLGKNVINLRRITMINRRRHCSEFCEYLNHIDGQKEACQKWDNQIANNVIEAAQENTESLHKFHEGFHCRFGLIDVATAIFHNQKPVAVVFTGQFLPKDQDSIRKIYENLNFLLQSKKITEDQQEKLIGYLKKTDTMEEFSKRNKHTNEPFANSYSQKITATNSPFLYETKRIQQIAEAQFQMHKHNLELKFKHNLREELLTYPSADRTEIAKLFQPIFNKVRKFCGTDFLALFISPQQYLSYEKDSNLLIRFLSSGLDEDILSKILHLNWSKAQKEINLEKLNGNHKSGSYKETILFQDDVKNVLLKGLKGENASFLMDSVMLHKIELSPSYHAVLLWGPFPQLNIDELKNEQGFLIDISEILLIRVLSSVQLSDSECRREVWEEVATILGHYFRRIMTPFSFGIKIILSYLKEKQTYTREDILETAKNLTIASEYLSQSVKAPLTSIAALTEKVYNYTTSSVSDLIHACVDWFMPYAKEKMVTVIIDPSIEILPPIEMDQAKLRDAIGYIIDNAIKYSHRYKEIRIYSERSNEKNIQIIIEDFGQGIEPSEQMLIFSRGYQGQRSQRALQEEGVGLGLYHARLIIESHKGRIWCDCRSGQRFDNSAKLEGYRVLFFIELPTKVQSKK